MQTLKTTVDQRRTDKRRLQTYLKSIEKTVRNMSYFPELDFLKEIAKQVLINEGLDDDFEVFASADSLLIVEKKDLSEIAAKIEILIVINKYNESTL